MMSDGAIRRLIVQLPKNLLFTSVERYLLSKEGGGGEKEEEGRRRRKGGEEGEDTSTRGDINRVLKDINVTILKAAHMYSPGS